MMAIIEMFHCKLLTCSAIYTITVITDITAVYVMADVTTFNIRLTANVV